MAFDFRVSPALWPVLAVASPVVVPWMAAKTYRFNRGRRQAAQRNADRIAAATPLNLPSLRSLEITVIVEHAHEPGFEGDAAVSYLVRTDRGGVLMDLGFGPEHPAFAHNAERLGLSMDDADALLISHLHLDHMGGMAAQRAREVAIPESFDRGTNQPCYVPDRCRAPTFDVRRVEGPMMVEGGLATTGPLARMLFFFGWLEEQALVARVEGKGLVVLTGCGHPTVEVILKMARKMSDEPLYALGGGLHFPITSSRLVRAGIQAQRVFGTGKAVWQQITDADLDVTIASLNAHKVQRLLLSAHDTCDHALKRLTEEVEGDVEILKAGASYSL